MASVIQYRRESKSEYLKQKKSNKCKNSVRLNIDYRVIFYPYSIGIRKEPGHRLASFPEEYHSSFFLKS